MTNWKFIIMGVLFGGLEWVNIIKKDNLNIIFYGLLALVCFWIAGEDSKR